MKHWVSRIRAEIVCGAKQKVFDALKSGQDQQISD
jgi:hypothetical protein